VDSDAVFCRRHLVQRFLHRDDRRRPLLPLTRLFRTALSLIVISPHARPRCPL
jgi:hypothetical protein